jgi:hypothetical protein
VSAAFLGQACPACDKHVTARLARNQFCVVKPLRWMRLPPHPKACVKTAAQQLERRAMSPHHINPLQWQQAIERARHVCARIYRDGGGAADALTAYGLSVPQCANWAIAVDRIAQALCAPGLHKPDLRKAA